MCTDGRPPASPSMLLLWPIKSSLIRYVRTRHDGALSADAGLRLDPETGVFCFPGRADSDNADSGDHLDSGDHPDSDHTAGNIRRFCGDLRLRAHGGMLFIRIADPALNRDTDGTWTMTVSGMYPDAPRITLAHLSILAARGRSTLFDAVLAPDGADFFGGYYAAGDRLDPVELRVVE